MWGHAQICCFGHITNFYCICDPADSRYIGLQYVESALPYVFEEICRAVETLTTCSCDGSVSAEYSVSGDVCRKQWLFNPDQIVLLQHFQAGYGLIDSPGLIGVDHEFHFCSDGLAYSRDPFPILFRIIFADLQLERMKLVFYYCL